MMIVSKVVRFYQATRRFGQGRLLTLLLIVLSMIGLLSQPAQAAPPLLKAAEIGLHNSDAPLSIKTAEQALLYVNAQNVVNTWNNIVIRAKTGDEQMKLMKESGVFADDVKLRFNFGDGQNFEFTGFDSPEIHRFFNGFINQLKKERYNVASNVEAVEFEPDSIRFNFKNWVFFNERLSMVGEDQAVMKREDERYQIKSADVRFVYFDVGHAY